MLVTCILRHKVILSSVLDDFVSLIIGLDVFLPAQGNLLSLNGFELIEPKSEKQAFGKGGSNNRRWSLKSVKFEHHHVGSQLVIQFNLRIYSLAE